MRLSVILLIMLIIIILDEINWCESLDYDDKFKYKLLKFLFLHKKYLKEKGLIAAAVGLAAASKTSSGFLPIPFPLPIP